MSNPEQPASDKVASADPAAEPTDTGPDLNPDTEPDLNPDTGEDDVRARFRAALAAKQAGQPHLGGAPRTGPAPAHSAAARPTRRFRRKSG